MNYRKHCKILSGSAEMIQNDVQKNPVSPIEQEINVEGLQDSNYHQRKDKVFKSIWWISTIKKKVGRKRSLRIDEDIKMPTWRRND